MCTCAKRPGRGGGGGRVGVIMGWDGGCCGGCMVVGVGGGEVMGGGIGYGGGGCESAIAVFSHKHHSCVCVCGYKCVACAM